MKRDPWQRCVYLCLRNTANDQPMVFTSTSDGGRRAVARLAQSFDQKRHKHSGLMPLVALATEYYQHETFGKIAKPAFKIIGWEPWDAELADEPTPLSRPSLTQAAVARRGAGGRNPVLVLVHLQGPVAAGPCNLCAGLPMRIIQTSASSSRLREPK